MAKGEGGQGMALGGERPGQGEGWAWPRGEGGLRPSAHPPGSAPGRGSVNTAHWSKQCCGSK